MSSSLTGLTSTTRSWNSSSSPADGRALPDGSCGGEPRFHSGERLDALAVIACGALAGEVRKIAARRAWPVQVCPLPAILHNRPEQIAPMVAAAAQPLQARGLRVALGYADCGSYGALDELCARLGISMLRGLHCYDVLGGPQRIRGLLAREPGTYLLTDFLVGSFAATVLPGLGLDRYPELWDDYFGHYRRLVWLAQNSNARLAEQAAEIARMFGLPLRTIEVGTGRLESQLARMVGAEN